jgi:hypothetical protein
MSREGKTEEAVAASETSPPGIVKLIADECVFLLKVGKTPSFSDRFLETVPLKEPF